MTVFDLTQAGPDANIEQGFSSMNSTFDVSELVREVNHIQSDMEQSVSTSNPFPQPESLPEIPFNRSKSVEMPVSTRNGRTVKVNEVPPKPALKRKPPPSPRPDDDALSTSSGKKSITIG